MLGAHMGTHSRRIALITPSASQPRFHRRAESLLGAGFAVTVYTFTRGLYEANRFPEGVEVIDLGRIENGKYFNRIPLWLAAIVKINRHERSKFVSPHLTYAFGFDSAILACATTARRTVFAYEVGDLRNPSPKSVIERLVYEVERKVVQQADLLVTTAPSFVSEYYASMDPTVPARAITIENKLSKAIREIAGRPRSQRCVPARVRIGFVGLLRYPRTVLPLLEAVSARPDRFELHVYGDGPLRRVIEDWAETHENVLYHGPFKNPQDLEKIYSGLDVNYVVYDTTDKNVRLAIPNKLYESLYFCVPLVVAAGTALADRVTGLGVGFVVDPRADSYVERFLDNLSLQEIVRRSSAAMRIPVTELVEDGQLISDTISRLLGNTGA